MQAMLTLNGTVANVFETPKGVKKTTGEVYGGYHKIQLMCFDVLSNGEKQAHLVDLSVEDITPFKLAENASVSVPVRAVVRDGKLNFYALKGVPPVFH